MSFFTQASFVMDPNVYGVGKLYVPKPTDGSGDLTFTRASNGTRVNQDGLIEKVRTNLLLQSNQFDTTWTLSGATLTSGQSGYDGSNDAWLLTKNAAFGRVDQTITSSGVQVYSLYAKANDSNWIYFRADYSGGISSGYFDLANGVGGSFGNIIDSDITAVGNGWYRIQIAFNQTISVVRIYPAEDNNQSGGTSGSIYIQDAQLETGDIATDYIPTTSTAVSVGPLANIPRLNYGADGCPSLLLEPQRTNLTTYSEAFDAINWNKRSGLIVTSNYSTSPDGYQNADRVQKGTSADGYIWKIATLSASTTYTFSVYAKGTGTIFFNIFDGTSPQTSSTFNLTSSWQRFTYTITTNSTTAGGDYGIKVSNDAELWGAQLEANASYASSYIGPTLGASVTRLADAAYKTGISSLIGQTEGTFYTDFTREGVSGTANSPLVNINDGSTSNRLRILSRSDAGIRILFQLNGNSIQYDASTGSAQISSIDQQVKIAIAYKSGDIAVYINGELFNASSNTLTISAPLSNYELNDGTTGLVVNQSLLFTSRLSNADLARLTSL